MFVFQILPLVIKCLSAEAIFYSVIAKPWSSDCLILVGEPLILMLTNDHLRFCEILLLHAGKLLDFKSQGI